MEKKISLSRSDVIKYLIFIGSIISAFAAQQYSIANHKERLDKLEREIKELRECQTESAEKVAQMNGKLDAINENVNVIKEAIINRGLAGNR